MSIATTEENQTEYLLDYKQFQKFYELLKPRSNLNFINKIQEKQLMYSTKYFPISHSELENIKSHLRNHLNEKLILEKNEGEKGLESSMEKSGEAEQSQSEEAEQSQSEGAEQSQSEGAEQQRQQQNEVNQQHREKKTEKNQIKSATFIWSPTKWQSFKIPNKRK